LDTPSYNTEIILKEVGREDVEWIPLAQDKIQWQAFVKKRNELKRSVTKMRNFLTS
jgi:hypothetical protein